jgi:hypothetical protein
MMGIDTDSQAEANGLVKCQELGKNTIEDLVARKSEKVVWTDLQKAMGWRLLCPRDCSSKSTLCRAGS